MLVHRRLQGPSSLGGPKRTRLGPGYRDGHAARERAGIAIAIAARRSLLGLLALVTGCSTPAAASNDEGAPPLVGAPERRQLAIAPPEPPVLELLPASEASGAELETLLADNPFAIGAISVGKPNRGALVNAVPMPEDDAWRLTEPDHCWGTAETISYLKLAITQVQAAHPTGPPLYVGHISARRGGYLKPHRSHQSGRDVDLGYYYLDPKPVWYQRATAKNLDVARTWLLVSTLLDQTPLEMIFMDRSVQTLLRRYAEDQGEDREWLDRVFKGAQGPRSATIRHAWRHATHMHVRFANPLATARGERAYRSLLAAGLIPKRSYY